MKITRRRQFELVDDLIANNNPLVYQQEYLAEFVDWSGVAFFMLDKMLVDGKPIDIPKRVDGVFCTIDTATKTGTANDGTAVVYWGFNRIGDGPPLALLDWDVVQIEGYHFPNCLLYFCKRCVRAGRIGLAWIRRPAAIARRWYAASPRTSSPMMKPRSARS